MQCRRLRLGLNTLVHPLHTEQTYKRQGHHTFETLCWIFCVRVESRNNGRTTVEVVN